MVRNSWIICIPIILSKNNFIVVNWKYRLKNLHFDLLIIKSTTRNFWNSRYMMKEHLLYTKNTFQINYFPFVNQLINKLGTHTFTFSSRICSGLRETGFSMATKQRTCRGKLHKYLAKKFEFFLLVWSLVKDLMHHNSKMLQQ